MTPDTLISFIKKEPWLWLWDPSIQVELFPLLPRLWDAIGDGERQALVDIILHGPPEDQFCEDLSSDERVEIRDRFVWERLIRLDSASVLLPEAARTHLRELKARYPTWKLTGQDRDYFPYWIASGTGFESDMSHDDLAQLSLGELLDSLVSSSYYREGRLRVWEGLVREKPDQAFRLINYMIQTQRIDENVLVHSFRGLVNKLELTEATIVDVKRIVETIPCDKWGRGIYPFAYMASRLIAEAPLERSTEVLNFWDQAITAALGTQAEIEGADLLNKAINHPVWDLTKALFIRLRLETRDEQHEIPDAIRSRLEFALQADEGGAKAARMFICSRLALLHQLDAPWSNKHVVPLFDWQNPSEATGAWQAFLPNIVSPELWSSLRLHFLNAFDHYPIIGYRAAELVEILVYAYSHRYTLSDAEASICLQKVDKDGLMVAARYLNSLLEGAGDRADQFWTDRVGPFFKNVWPKDESSKSERLTAEIAMAVILSGGVFRDAVEIVTPLMKPIPFPLRILDRLDGSGYPDRFPNETLRFLDALVANGARLGSTQLSTILQRLAKNADDLNDSTVRRLRDAAERG